MIIIVVIVFVVHSFSSSSSSSSSIIIVLVMFNFYLGALSMPARNYCSIARSSSNSTAFLY